MSYSYNNDETDTKLYVTDTESFLANNNTFSASTDEEFESNNFQSGNRNKGDISSKKGIYYEIFVFSFADSDGDGVGDFNGIASKLDYLQDLGIDGLWLSPIFYSESYHGYDVEDYNEVNPLFGTIDDFKNLVNEVHNRGMKIIIDYPINHTSSLCDWFIEATSNPDSKYVDYYNFVNKDDTSKYSLDEKSPWYSDVWHSFDDSYYYGIYGEAMPDLNFNNPEVRQVVIDNAVLYAKLGVDGFRLDGAMHIFEPNEYNEMTNSTQQTITWWNEFACALEEVNPDIYLVGEVWHETDTLEEYVQPFDTKFDFALNSDITRILTNDTAHLNGGIPISQEIEELYSTYNSVDTNFLDGPFLSNHDQNRIMTTLNGDTNKAKLAANIYLTLPGNPFLYYGEEIGMLGGNGDDSTKREYFKWTNDSHDLGNAYCIDLGGNTTTPSLEEQMSDEDSIYNHYKEIISIRKNTPALTSAYYSALNIKDNSILAYIRGEGDESVYVIHNLCSDTVSTYIDGITNGQIIYNSNDSTTISDSTLTIAPYSTIIVKPN